MKNLFEHTSAPWIRYSSYEYKAGNDNNLYITVFKGKRQIDWDDVKQYLEGYVGDYYEISENAERIFIRSELPEEYTESESRKSLMGANAKAKANAATAIPQLIQIASNPTFEKTAKYGWYRYDVRFALPVYEENTLVRYNIFHARLLINRKR